MKILVADDEQFLRWFLERSFKKNGHEVITAGNVKDACAILSSESIDVLFIDIRMPGEDGTELIGKGDVRGKKPRVIVCSAFITADREEELRQEGVCIIKKPFMLDELNDAVEICREKNSPFNAANCA